jgi:hypothetical protein
MFRRHISSVIIFILMMSLLVGLFFLNDPAWLYLYFLLWFIVLTIIQILIYLLLTKKIESHYEKLIPLSLILLADSIFFYCTIYAGAMTGQAWFLLLWQTIKILVVASSVLIFFLVVITYFINDKKIIVYQFFKKHHRLSRIKISLSPNKRKILFKSMKLFTIFLMIFLIFFQTLLFFPFFTIPLMGVRSDANVTELNNIVKDIIKNDTSNYAKAQSILNWFNRKSGNMYNVWGYPLISGLESNGRLNFGDYFLCILCMRNYGRDTPLWILTSRCGSCEEHALLYREMAHAANIPVRSIHCYEGNHCWDEVFINNTWIIVDPARQLFNPPRENYSKEFKNPRYILAELPEGSKVIDATKNYSKLVNVSLFLVDKNNITLPHIRIEVFSSNETGVEKRTELFLVSDENGRCNFTLGAGWAIFQSKDNYRKLNNYTLQNLSENKNYNIKVVLKNYIEPDYSLIFLLFVLIFFIYIFNIFYKSRRRRTQMKENGESDNSYFISFIDALGFKGLVNTNSQFPELQKVYRSTYRLIWGIREAHRTGNSNEFIRFLSPYIGNSRYVDEILTNNVFNFSDSIVIYIKGSNDYNDNIERLRSLCWVTNVFIAKSILSGDESVFELPLRAAIAYGPAVIDEENKIIVGKPITDAYELSNALDWMGGAIHPSVPEKYIRPLVGFENEIYAYPVPVKKLYMKENNSLARNIRYALNWVRQHPSHESFYPIMRGRSPRPLLVDIGNAHVLHHVWGCERRKRRNTMRFVERICDEYDMSETT